jgi:pyruvate dehydrogenase E2 component (dihydrolipoamide acetyltransferase)
MANQITVPRLGWTMEEGIFSGWLKQDGDVVKDGDPLYELESDKATQEVEGFDDGILRWLPNAPQTGDTVIVGQLLGFVLEVGEDMPAIPDQAAVAVAAVSTPPPPIAPPQATGAPTIAAPTPTPVAAALPRAPEAKIRITPRAIRVARELGVDWSNVTGSGKNGRIRERDIRASAVSMPASQARAEVGESDSAIRVTSRRRTIAQRMVAGVNEAAPVTLSVKVDATCFAQSRPGLGKINASAQAPSFTAMFVRLAAMALRHHPLLNSLWNGDEIIVRGDVNIGIAVDAADGLMVPVVSNADSCSLSQTDAIIRELAAAARDGKLSAAQMQNGTFTISNLGMFGVDAFTPILNLPQCAVLGIGRIVSEPAVFNGDVVPRDMVTLSLTFDHRIVDGADAARFLDTVREGIETPLSLMA